VVDLNYIRHVQKDVAKHQLGQVKKHEPNQTYQYEDESMIDKWQIENTSLDNTQEELTSDNAPKSNNK
jgi:hypothetical protein